MRNFALLARLRTDLPKTSTRRYAGIGSRETPEHICARMTAIAEGPARAGFILRTGGAIGADTAFLAGTPTDAAPELFVPWEGYNEHRPGRGAPSRDAYDLAAMFHPAWGACSEGAKAMHARNSHIVLGANLHTPVDFVLCWTPDAVVHGRTSRKTGGTGQALRIANYFRIPIYNLARPDHLEEWSLRYA